MIVLIENLGKALATTNVGKWNYLVYAVADVYR